MTWPNTVRKEDLRIEYYRGSGAGGQKRNKTSSAVRITHVVTGLVGQSQDERSQAQNRKTAFQRLCDKLIPLMKREVQKQRYAAGEDRIRTYHKPDQRVTDVRLPGKQWRYDDVVDGTALREIIEDLTKQHNEEALKQNG